MEVGLVEVLLHLHQVFQEVQEVQEAVVRLVLHNQVVFQELQIKVMLVEMVLPLKIVLVAVEVLEVLDKMVRHTLMLVMEELELPQQ